MRRNFIALDSCRTIFRRFRESDVSTLVLDSELDVRFYDGFFRCSLETSKGSILLSDKSFSRLRREVYRLYALRLGLSVAFFSISFNIHD